MYREVEESLISSQLIKTLSLKLPGDHERKANFDNHEGKVLAGDAIEIDNHEREVILAGEDIEVANHEGKNIFQCCQSKTFIQFT